MDPQKTPLGQPPADNNTADLSIGPNAAQDASNTVVAPAAGSTFKPESPAVPSMEQQSSADGEAKTDAPGVLPSSPESSTPAPSAPSPDVTLSAAQAPIDPIPLAPKSGFGKKGLLLGIVAAVIVLLGGGAAAAYYLVTNSPENVLKQALANSLDATKAKTVQFSGLASINDGESDMDIEANFTGAANNQTGAFDVSSTLDVLVTNLTFDARSVDGKTYYFKIGGLAGLSELLAGSSDPIVSSMDALAAAAYAPLLDSVNNQWLEVNQSLIKQATGVTPTQLSDADRQKLLNAYQQHTFIVIKEKLASQIIKGTNSYHYKVGIDKTALKAFVAAVKSANVESLKLSDDKMKELNASIDKADFSKQVADIWIAKSDKTIRQFAIKLTEGEDTLSLRLTIDSYNKPVNVEKPADAKSLLEFIGGLMGDSPVVRNDAMLDAKLQSGISL